MVVLYLFFSVIIGIGKMNQQIDSWGYLCNQAQLEYGYTGDGSNIFDMQKCPFVPFLDKPTWLLVSSLSSVQPYMWDNDPK